MRDLQEEEEGEFIDFHETFKATVEYLIRKQNSFLGFAPILTHTRKRGAPSLVGRK